MSIDSILSRLERVKKSGNNRWLACCPAHLDKTPSLSIMQNDTGKVFVHCFAGCEGVAIMASIDMTLADLYPERIEPPKGTGKKPSYNPYDVLKALAGQAQIVAMLGGALADHPLSDRDREALFKAVGRINAALRLMGVRHGI